MIKHLRRTVIIRKYDYDRKLPHAQMLYDTCRFDPLLRKSLEQEYIYRTLNNTLPPPWGIDLTGGIRNLLQAQTDLLYDTKYLTRNLEEDEEGHIWIWYRENTPRSILGLATFEYTYSVKDRLTNNDE